MAKKKISKTTLILGAVAVGVVGYLVLRKPTTAISGSSNGNGNGGTADRWTYRITSEGPLYLTTIYDSVGNSENLAPQASYAAAVAMAQSLIRQYGGIPVLG